MDCADNSSTCIHRVPHSTHDICSSSSIKTRCGLIHEGLATNSTAMVSLFLCSVERPSTPRSPTRAFLNGLSSTKSITSSTNIYRNFEYLHKGVALHQQPFPEEFLVGDAIFFRMGSGLIIGDSKVFNDMLPSVERVEGPGKIRNVVFPEPGGPRSSVNPKTDDQKPLIVIFNNLKYSLHQLLLVLSTQVGNINLISNHPTITHVLPQYAFPHPVVRR
ncbi:hypothetical protein RJ639_026084 [Escallonia herrerae]|uniref:Uncharacterized protein n=1 Tax=Escallonia herrerae TaxID=1293975 RepID=A0AA88S622_9ASTE|nr:hypothetical protein RJ639_026084 [Escallonia herrerae]